MDDSRPLESPGAWLARELARRRLPYTRLARALGEDKSRFGRWLRSQEQIPRVQLAVLARHLPAADFSYALRLKDCEDLEDQLRRGASALTRQLGLGPRPVAALLAKVRSVAGQGNGGSGFAFATALAGHLADAVAAVQLVGSAAASDFEVPLLTPTTVPRFRYPINHFVGLLLDAEQLVPSFAPEAAAVCEFRERVLASLRRVVWAEPPHQPMELLPQEFSTHLLARHGTPDDRGEIKDRLRRRSRFADGLLRRLSFTGLLAGRRDQRVSGQFLRDLERDRNVAAANLFFNAFHYGDLALTGESSLRTQPRAFAHAVPHILRHLEEPRDYVGIQDAECLTLTQVLEATGPDVFLRPANLARLRRLVAGDDRPLLWASHKARARLERAFRPLLGRAV